MESSGQSRVDVVPGMSAARGVRAVASEVSELAAGSSLALMHVATHAGAKGPREQVCVTASFYR